MAEPRIVAEALLPGTYDLVGSLEPVTAIYAGSKRMYFADFSAQDTLGFKYSLARLFIVFLFL